MRRVLATAGHVDHGKSTLVRALTGRDPDRLAQEKARGLTIELGFAWTSLPGAGDLAFVDVPGHQRFVATMLSGLGPSPAVLFVVAADQGWQEQSSEHLAAVDALGITDGVLVVTRCDLADEARREEVGREASSRLAGAGLHVPRVEVSAVTGLGVEELRAELTALVHRLPPPDEDADVRLWCDRAFTVAGAGTVVTGTLGAGRLAVGERLTLLDHGRVREVQARGLHSQDEAREVVGPVSRVAVNLRRVDAGALSRSAVLFTPGAFVLARVVDVVATAVDAGTAVPWAAEATPAALPDRAVLHVGSGDETVTVRPLGAAHARLTTSDALPWRVGDRAIVRDPSRRMLWSIRVVDVDPLPLRRRGAASRRGAELDSGRPLADVRLSSRSADHPQMLARLGLPEPTNGTLVGGWWFDPAQLTRWSQRLGELVRAHHSAHPLDLGPTVAEVQHQLGVPEHLRPAEDGGSLPPVLSRPGPALLTHLAVLAGLEVVDGRLRDPGQGSGLGAAEAGVGVLERALAQSPFAAPDRDTLTQLGLGAVELAAAARTGRLLRLADDVVLLPDGPARAMRVLAALEQPFTLSAARQALGTTRRVAVPLLEHLDSRRWTIRLDGRLRRVAR